MTINPPHPLETVKINRSPNTATTINPPETEAAATTINSPHPPKTVKRITFTFSRANTDTLSINASHPPTKTVKKVTFSLPKRDTSSTMSPPHPPPLEAEKKVVSCLRFVEKVGLRSVADDDDLIMVKDFLKTLMCYQRGSIDKNAVEALMKDIFRNHPDLFAQFRHDYIRGYSLNSINLSQAMEIDPDTHKAIILERSRQFVTKVKLRSVGDGDDLLMFNDFLEALTLYEHGFIPNLKGLEVMMRDIFKNHPDLMAELRKDFLRIRDDDDSSSSGGGYNLRDLKKMKRK